MTAPRGWVVFGCRTPYAVEAAEIVWRRGEEVRLLVDNSSEGERWTGAEAGIDPAASIAAPVVGVEALPEAGDGLATTVPLVTPGLRRAAVDAAREAGLAAFPTLVDPAANLARTAAIDEGSIVNVAAIVGAASRLGRFVLVNRGTSIGHHCEVDDYAAFGPGSVLAGSVWVGHGAFVGADAVCAPHVEIGANATVGAGAVVVADVPPHAVVVGNPARVVREDAGYEGLEVAPD